MESELAAVIGGLGVTVVGLAGMLFRRNGSNGILKRLDKRTEEMCTLLKIIADRGIRGE